MTKKVFIDPEDGTSFASRKLAKAHMLKKGHRGAIIVEEVETKPTVSKTTNVKPAKKMSDKEKRMEEAWATYSEFVEKGDKDKVAISKTAKAMGEKEGKIKGWIGTMRGKMRREAKKAKKTPAKKVQTKQPEPEPEPEPVVTAWIRLRNEDAEKIKNSLIEGMILFNNPVSGNAILQYTNYQYSHLDDLMFIHNFGDVAMFNSDVLFCLELLNRPNNEMYIYDTAQLKTFGIKEMEDNKIIVSGDNSFFITSQEIQDGLSNADANTLACVTGIWKKTYTATPKKKETPPKVTTAIVKTPEKKQEVSTQETSQAYVENFEDWDIGAWSAERYPFTLKAESEEEDRYWDRYDYGWGGYGGGYRTSYTKPKPIAPPTPLSYAVYGVSDNAIVVDRVIEYDEYK